MSAAEAWQAFKHKLIGQFQAIWQKREAFSPNSDGAANRPLLPFIGVGVAVYFLLAIILGIVWSKEPELKPLAAVVNDQVAGGEQGLSEPLASLPTGLATSRSLVFAAQTLLEKPGGFLSNDIAPPGWWLDNMPNWEFGVLVQVRDLSRALRKDFARSQSQSQEDPDLAVAEPQFNFDNSSWAFPASESEYKRGIRKLEKYVVRLQDESVANAQFYARADNLNFWLADVSTRLGSLSQRLSASVGRERINTDLGGDSRARQSTPAPAAQYVHTPWSQIDDVFYEARGSAWALIHFLRAIEHDFADVLAKKNALISLRQIIRELEATQDAVWAPMILNGDGFGLLANHSLVMANYISRANAAIIDLRNLLSQG